MMRKFTKIILSGLFAVLLLAGILPVSAEANMMQVQTITQTNPRYPDLSVPALSEYSVDGTDGYLSAYAVPEQVDSIEEAASVLRKEMAVRNPEISIRFTSDSSDVSGLAYEIADLAMEHTGVPNQGDYIAFQWKKWDVSMLSEEMGGRYTHTFTYRFQYFTSLEQENQVTERLKEILASFDLEGKSDFEKVRMIYDYIIRNVAYEYEQDSGDDLIYSAYGALIRHKAVCQGYSVLFYRMALECGVDARVIDSEQLCHAWNIARIGKYYYLLDSTWDSPNQGYDFFLRGKTDFPKHENSDDQFQDPDFCKRYPVKETRYAGVSKTIPSCTIQLKSGYTYSGKEIRPGVTVYNEGVLLEENVHYVLTYSDNVKVGQGRVRVEGIGEYQGSEELMFKILPKMNKAITLRNTSSGIRVSWKKSAGVTGYQIQYAQKRNFSNAKTTVVKGGSSTAKTVAVKKKNTTYYVRVRAYKTVSGKNYYSAWSSIGKVQVKK